ncbi:MAG TPA: hypothetical protein VHE12_07480 [bacterium]|nr:hypothetical protein [bacterium]
MAKGVKKESVVISDPNRCEICGTKLTLYPKSYAPCPRCQKRVCRRCWDASWASKSFASDQCSHMQENDGQTLNPVEGGFRFQWDWYRILASLVVVALLAILLYFVLNLFVF